MGRDNNSMWIIGIITIAIAGLAARQCRGGGSGDDYPDVYSKHQEAVATKARSQESAWIAEMQSRVRQRMKDPDSAEFRSSFLSRKSGAPVVCGEVNANNSFGGKGGYQRFVASGDIIALEEQMADGEMDKTWAAVCE